MNLIYIEDINSQEINIFTDMKETQLRHIYEPELGGFIAESPNVILRAVDAGYEPISMMVEDGTWSEYPDEDKTENNNNSYMRDVCFQVMQLMGDKPIYVIKPGYLKEYKDMALVRGAMCFMRRKPECDPTNLIREAKGNIAVLEDVTNPTNLGAIFRSAAALGISGIIMTSGCADPLYRRATRVSMGTVFNIPWTYTTDINDTLRVLREEGYISLAMALDDRAVSICDEAVKKKARKAIVLGAEGYGLKTSTIENCDYTVMIPMAEGIDSLNVAAASAVAFWELKEK